MPGAPNRGPKDAPYAVISVRRGSDADALEVVRCAVPYVSRSKLATVAMRLGLQLFLEDPEVLQEALKKHG